MKQQTKIDLSIINELLASGELPRTSDVMRQNRGDMQGYIRGYRDCWQMFQNAIEHSNILTMAKEKRNKK